MAFIDQHGPQFGQLSLPHAGIPREKGITDGQIKDRITQELKPFVIGIRSAIVLEGEGPMNQGKLQEADIPEIIPQAQFKLVELRLIASDKGTEKFHNFHPTRT
jgi:hypothetical protein